MNINESFTLDGKSAKKLLNGLFKNNYNLNIDTIKDLIFNSIDSKSIEHVLCLMFMEEEYKVLDKGDYFMTLPEKYDQGSEFEVDILIDMGLYHSSGKVYGIVKDDNSWDEKTYNPLYSRLKVDLLYHDDKGKLKKVEKSINPLSLKKIAKTRIPYYKNTKTKKDAKIITVTDPVTL